ncbi:hypothetical protein, partial [Frankia casuarinae]
MTDPQPTQAPPSYPDPLTDAVSAAAEKSIGALTAVTFAAQILVERKSGKTEQETARLRDQQDAWASHHHARRFPHGDGPGNSADRDGSARDRGADRQDSAARQHRTTDLPAEDRAAAKQAVSAVFADRPALRDAIREADAFDAFARRLTTLARDLSLHPADVLRHARGMAGGLERRDAATAAATLHARLGWLADPTTAPRWAQQRAQKAHNAAHRQDRVTSRSPQPRRPTTSSQTRQSRGGSAGQTRRAAYPASPLRP